uniref:Uncharacterized protein n=2 Tax=viral metagenome TaxID=1070528 RepID=A0A6H1ZLF8_9ZZZZ
MMIVRPFTSDKDPNNHYTTRLHFENGVVKNFYMRGAVAWPEGKKEGFAIMAGMDLIENVVIIFEQFRFWTVGHWLKADGNITEREDGPGYHLGLIQFITDNLSLYRCCTYFWGGQHIDIWNRFGREIYSNPQTPKKIELIEVPYAKEVGPDLLLEKLKTRKFKGESDSLLEKSVTQFVNMQAADAGYDNAALSLMSLLVGFDFMPWVKIND